MQTALNNPFIAPAAQVAADKSNTLHALVQPFQVAELNVEQVLARATSLLARRGETEAFRVARTVLQSADDVEIRCLLEQRRKESSR